MRGDCEGCTGAVIGVGMEAAAATEAGVTGPGAETVEMDGEVDAAVRTGEVADAVSWVDDCGVP